MRLTKEEEADCLAHLEHAEQALWAGAMRWARQVGIPLPPPPTGLAARERRLDHVREWAGHPQANGLAEEYAAVETSIWAVVLRFTSLAESLGRQYARYGGEYSDLVAEAQIGIRRGLLRFDPAKEARLATYLRWWARAAVTRCPETAACGVSFARSATEQRRLLHRLRGDGQSYAALADQTGVSLGRVESLLSFHLVYLDGSEENLSSMSCLPDFDHEIDQQDRLGQVRQAVAALAAASAADQRGATSRRDMALLTAYVQPLLDGLDAPTFAALARRHGISRERVRQVVDDGFRQIASVIRCGEARRVDAVSPLG